jgi:pyruvate dehydrogenase E2 component (dihydrolipoamide acetyltransferase)
MATEFKLPDLGEGIKTADVVKVLVREGESVAAGQNVLEVETDKAGVDVPSPVGGRVTKVLVKAGEKAAIGQVILVIDETQAAAPPPVESKPEPVPEAVPEPESVPKPQPEPEPTPAPAPSAAQHAPVFASPSVRQFAREIGVDIHEVEGTGPGGRISLDDVKHYARQVGRAVTAASAAPESFGLPEFEKWGPIRVEPMTNVRRATAQYMAECWRTIPHVTIFDQVDITRLEAWRESLKPRADKAGVKITVTAILMRVAAAALKRFPRLNATIDVPGERIILKDYCHLGVAVDTERGLVVPVVRDADSKSLFALAGEIAELAATARRGKLAPDAMAGATFTLTNLGGIGVGWFTPVVPSPQVAILGIGRAVRQPVWDEAHGAWLPRLLMPLSLSIDHRLVDGADGARFLRFMVGAIEEPLSLLEG